MQTPLSVYLLIDKKIDRQQKFSISSTLCSVEM